MKTSHKLDFLVGVIVAVLFSHPLQCYAAIVNYVYSPLCITAPGCSFSDNIWDTTSPLSFDDDVVIQSNVSITISIYSTLVSIATISFGISGSPVTLQVVNSTLIFNGNNNTKAPHDPPPSLVWGDNSAINAFNSNITFLRGAGGGTGTSLGLYYSTMVAPLAIVLSNLTVGYSKLSAAGALTVNFTVAQFSTIQTSNLLATTFYSYSNLLDVASLAISDYAIIYNNTGLAYSFPVKPILFTLQPFAYMQIYDTVTILDELVVNEYAYFTFQTTSPQTNFLYISLTIAEYGSELNLGDNSYVLLQNGNINNLTLGDNVTITVSSYVSVQYKDMVIANMEQLDNNSFTNLTVRYGELQLWTQSNEAQLNAVINVQNSATLTVRTELYLSPGSIIQGSGILYVSGRIDCPQISIHTVKIALANSLLNVDTLTASLLFPNYVGSSPVVILNGSLSIVPTSPNDGIKFSELFKLSVLGNFYQTGGHMNFSVHEKAAGTSAFLQVSGSAVVSNVTLGIVTDTEVQSSDRWFLLQAADLSISNMSIVDVYQNSTFRSYFYSQENGLYLAYHMNNLPVHEILTELQFWLIFGAGIAFIFLLIGLVVFVQKRKTKQRGYEQLT